VRVWQLAQPGRFACLARLELGAGKALSLAVAELPAERGGEGEDAPAEERLWAGGQDCLVRSWRRPAAAPGAPAAPWDRVQDGDLAGHSWYLTVPVSPL
jgi:hypothetical protein